jgi:hypothetical protein
MTAERMRCARTFSRCAWAIVLLLAVGPAAAFAESFACYPIQRGDSASRLAKRLTGNASNEYQPWFDIVDLVGRSVPKSQYNRVRAGWRACIREKPIKGPLLEARQIVADEAAPQVVRVASPPPADTPRTIQTAVLPSATAVRADLNVDAAHIWLGVAIGVPALGFLIVGGYIRRRNTSRAFMNQFANLFVREFERPLLQHAGEPAIRVRLRVNPYWTRLEICLAPGKGHRYPNLSDHRKNVEYDVHRVLSALADESFLCGRLRTREEWVVVPFRFSVRLKRRGVRCISSL